MVGEVAELVDAYTLEVGIRKSGIWHEGGV